MSKISEAFSQIGPDFNMAPFAFILGPYIDEVLDEQGLNTFRKGTILINRLLMWLILMLTIRRDLSYNKVLNWMVSGYRWIKKMLPPKNKIVKDGTISKARIKLGVKPLKALFYKLRAAFVSWPKDFYKWTSLSADGTTITMPDTLENIDKFKKPSSRKGSSGFPQVRMMSLLINPLHLIFDIEYAPYSGKKTGERTLLMNLIERFQALSINSFLFLLDAGLYSTAMLWQIKQKGQDFIIKAPSNVKLKSIKQLADGSFIALLTHKVLDLDAPPRRDGKKSWKKVSITVRIIEFEIPGFRPVRLVTTILDETITAREIALHYHSRWEIEIAYDDIKTHQSATLRGQLPTVLRSKRPDLVLQELYAILIMYNSIRLLIHQAAIKHNKDPILISFSDALEHIISASPNMIAQSQEEQQEGFAYLLELIADCEIDRPRRPRVNPRVVKVKMSSFARKNKNHKSEKRNLADELTIIFPPGFSLNSILKMRKDEFNQTKRKRPPKYKPEEIPLRRAA